ncbi:MAG: hypothetical protein WKF82_06085 [Nocardioidaceae bacterium]
MPKDPAFGGLDLVGLLHWIGVSAARHVDQVEYPLDPRHFEVTAVPQQGQHTAWTQDPSNFGQGSFAIEPVKRLRGDDHVSGGGCQGDVFSSGERSSCRWHGQRQLDEHVCRRIGGHDVMAERAQRGGEFAGARTEFEHPRGLRADQPLDGFDRVGRPMIGSLGGTLPDLLGRGELVGGIHAMRLVDARSGP